MNKELLEHWRRELQTLFLAMKGQMLDNSKLNNSIHYEHLLNAIGNTLDCLEGFRDDTEYVR